MGVKVIDMQCGIENHPTTRSETGVSRRIWAVAACCLALALSGCKPINEPNTVKADGPVAAEAVQATLTAPADSASGGIWPPKVDAYAADYEGPVWYPRDLPDGYSVVSLDVVEMQTDSGLVCDIVFLKGDDAITFTQGSDEGRMSDIASLEQVAWGEEQADVISQDPTDDASPKMIVFSTGDTLAELSGTVDLDTLKSVAASMMPVK